jgi:dipeptidyl aminopeptidase/acylaminoacyl peptidase
MRNKEDERLESMYRRFSWRIMSNSVSPWEFEKLKEEIEDYEQWCSKWCARATEHVARGDEASAGGHLVTAGEAYIRAGLFYHWASFMFTHDQEQFREALNQMGQAWAKAAPLLSPTMEILTIDFEGATLNGYIQLPPGVVNPPLVLLLPGADSTKEELYDLAQHILRRGMAIAAFDGPGQGAVSLTLKMRKDHEVAIIAILDSLLERSDIDTSRIALCGISYGGLFSLRAAAIDQRIHAVVSVSSWYSPAGRFATMETLTSTGQYQYLGDDPAAMMESITLAGVLDGVRIPVLQVFGGLDPWSPPAIAEQIASEIHGPNTTMTYPDGVHILNNIWFKARPMIGDWLAAAF